MPSDIEIETLVSAQHALAAIQKFNQAVDRITDEAGGILRCESCHEIKPVEGRYWREGWPVCCGETMRWWRRQEVKDGLPGIDPETQHIHRQQALELHRDLMGQCAVCGDEGNHGGVAHCVAVGDGRHRFGYEHLHGPDCKIREEAKHA